MPESTAAGGSPEETELRAAIDGLYLAFAYRPLRSWTDPCLDCCATEEQERALHAVPLRELSKEALGPYVSSGSTWGDERDFAHLLPRVFEIVSFDDFDWPVVTLLVGRAGESGLADWPPAEVEAVDRWTRAWWRQTLAMDSPVHPPVDVLCAIARAIGDVTAHLADWIADDRPPASRHLVRLVLEEWVPATRELDDVWWEDVDRGAHVGRWIATPPVVERLRRIADATEHAGDPIAAEATLAWQVASRA